MNNHQLQPIELIVLEQASHVSNPIRRQANELMNEAILHDLRAAQQIMDAQGIEGQVIGIERDSTGKPVSIKWEQQNQQAENHKHTTPEAP